MIRLLAAILLIGVIAANGLIYLKLNALEARVSQLQARTLVRMSPNSNTPPSVSDPAQEALLKEAAPLLDRARSAIQNADYSRAQALLKEARGPLNEMKKTAGAHSTLAFDWLHHQIDDLHNQIAK